ncbi:uncharacterized protein [Diadema antillarum]|uniref:uncharacterized protein n=1 Tax=Diadema antillarum TaxID=105358 RepID=UPI003A845AAC
MYCVSLFSVRLVGGSDDHEGRVEIFCDGQWGTVCDDGWDMKEAHAVCRQLGYTAAASVHHNAHFGQGSGPIWIDDETYCPTGNENSLLECQRLPWGCFSRRSDTSWVSCGHGNDVGVRCQGQADSSAPARLYAEGTRTLGLNYGLTNYVYYNMRSELTFTPTATNNGDLLQCHVLGLLRSTTLQVSGRPAERIISVEFEDIVLGNEPGRLKITCRINSCDQPSPPISWFDITVDGRVMSSSNSPTAMVSPRPASCVQVNCTGINDHGRTESTRTYCPPPRRTECEESELPTDGILKIDNMEIRGENKEINLLITCHVNVTDQPYPYIHTYTIGADDTTLSSSSSGSAVLTPRPNKCINVTCEATNGVGVTSSWLFYCPQDAPPRDIVAIQYETLEQDGEGATEYFMPRESSRSTKSRPPPDHILTIEVVEIKKRDDQVALVITCHVTLDNQPYPHLHTYTIGADNTNISTSSCASAILRARPQRCINVTCAATNGLGTTSVRREYCPIGDSVQAGPTAGYRQGALQRSSTTYSLLVVIFVLSMVHRLPVDEDLFITMNGNGNLAHLWTLFIAINVCAATSVTLEVPSSVQHDDSFTAVCSAQEIYGSDR